MEGDKGGDIVQITLSSLERLRAKQNVYDIPTVPMTKYFSILLFNIYEQLFVKPIYLYKIYEVLFTKLLCGYVFTVITYFIILDN